MSFQFLGFISTLKITVWRFKKSKPNKTEDNCCCCDPDSSYKFDSCYRVDTLHFARPKIDNNNRAISSPYLDENNKMNAHLRTFERWPCEIEADSGSAENAVIVEDSSDSHSQR